MTDLVNPFDPLVPVEPVVEPEPEKKPVEPEVPVVEPEPTEKAKLLLSIQDALAEANGLESNIGTSHPYWGWVNKYRGM